MSYPVRPRWDPFTQLQTLRAELSRMLGGSLAGSGGVRRLPGSGGGLLPEVEVHRDDEGFTVTARLPGVASEEVAVEVDSRELRIRARSAAETEQVTGVPEGEPGGPRPRERMERAFDYRLSLAGDVDLDKVDATMDHGLLTVRLPRMAHTGRRQVPIGRRAG
jgi:HSP20 family protein